MNCPYCSGITQSGTVNIMACQGFGSTMVDFIPEEEAKKSFWKRETQGRILLSGDSFPARYCPACGKLLLSLEVN